MLDADFGVFDIECETWDRFVVGATLIRDNLRVFRNQNRMIDYMLQGGTWYAHNAGRYDGLWFMEGLRKRKIENRQTIAGSRLLRIEAGECTIADSFAFVPMKLETAAEIAGEKKGKTGLPCECGKNCGGYCSIRRDMPEAHYKKVIEYLAQDCRSLHAVIEFLIEWCGDNGIDLKGTIGSSAWATAKTLCELPDAPWGSIKGGRSAYNFARDGYFGGRVEVFQPKVSKGWRYDIHSSYPAALKRTAIPIGDYKLIEDPKDARVAYRKGRPGIYGAQVTVKDNEWIPVLPVRTGERIVFPVGSFYGSWSEIELRYAEECGTKIDDVLHAIVWEADDKIVAPYCDHVWKLRDREVRAGNEALGRWIKWLANSLTGKFAMNPEIYSTRMSEDDPGEGWNLFHEDGFLWFTTIRRYHACGHVQWSAYLTSEARIELHKQLRAAGNHVVYCDTDSVYSTKKLTRRIGDDLGEWGCEGSMKDWHAIAPKLYMYVDQDGKAKVRGKGLSGLTAEGFRMIAEGGTWEDEKGVLSFRQAARSNGSMFKRRVLRRKLKDPHSLWFGGRYLIDGRTYPTTPRQVEDRTPPTRTIPGR